MAECFVPRPGVLLRAANWLGENEKNPRGCSSASITTSSDLSFIPAVFFPSGTDSWLVGTSHTWLTRSTLRSNLDNWAFSAAQTGCWCLMTGCRSQFSSLGGWEVGGREVEVGRGSYRSVVFLGPLLAAVSSDRNFNLSPVRHRLHPKVSPFSFWSLLHLNRFSVSSTTVLAKKQTPNHYRRYFFSPLLPHA